MKNNTDSRFDLDLSFGVNMENKLLKALESTIEVKSERDKWLKTGNIAVEYMSREMPSGILVTEADHWTHVLTINGKPYCYLIFPTPVMKKIVSHYREHKPETIRRGGDHNTSEMVLLPLRDIVLPK